MCVSKLLFLRESREKYEKVILCSNYLVTNVFYVEPNYIYDNVYYMVLHIMVVDAYVKLAEQICIQTKLTLSSYLIFDVPNSLVITNSLEKKFY